MKPTVYDFEFYERNRPTFLARVVGADGVAIKQADVSSIAVSIRSYDDPATEHETDAPVVATAISDTLQTTDDDPRWTKDTIGYNFAYTPVLGKFDQDGGYTYLVEITFTTTDDIIPQVWKAEQLAVASTP